MEFFSPHYNIIIPINLQTPCVCFEFSTLANGRCVQASGGLYRGMGFGDINAILLVCRKRHVTDFGQTF